MIKICQNVSGFSIGSGYTLSFPISISSIQKSSIYFLTAWFILFYLVSPVHMNLLLGVSSSPFSLTVLMVLLSSISYLFCFLTLFKCTLEPHGKMPMRYKLLCEKLFLTLAQQVNRRHFLKVWKRFWHLMSE